MKKTFKFSVKPWTSLFSASFSIISTLVAVALLEEKNIGFIFCSLFATLVAAMITSLEFLFIFHHYNKQGSFEGYRRLPLYSYFLIGLGVIISSMPNLAVEDFNFHTSWAIPVALIIGAGVTTIGNLLLEFYLEARAKDKGT